MICDKTLECRDCGAEFNFSAGEQEFFIAKGLSNVPRRCQNCRIVARIMRSGLDSDNVGESLCAGCGSLAKVPFQPKGYSPVYCAACFQDKKIKRAATAAAEPAMALVSAV